MTRAIADHHDRDGPPGALGDELCPERPGRSGGHAAPASRGLGPAVRDPYVSLWQSKADPQELDLDAPYGNPPKTDRRAGEERCEAPLAGGEPVELSMWLSSGRRGEVRDLIRRRPPVA